MLHTSTSIRRQPSPLPAARTYVVLDVGDAAARLKPLGTVNAPCRGSARALAVAVYADVSPARLRVVAAGSAPGDLVLRALARDGEAAA